MKELASKVLYVPDFSNINIKQNFAALVTVSAYTYEPMTTQEIESLYSNYKYEYKLIDDESLNEKIISGEEFYYLRNVRLSIVSKEILIEVVNGKTGKVIYRGLSHSDNLKPMCITNLSRAIFNQNR